MTEIDMLLDKMRAAPVPSRLEALDGAVLDALAAQRENGGPGARLIGMAALAAMTIGILGAMPGGEVKAAPPGSPLGGVSALAPSALLDSKR